MVGAWQMKGVRRLSNVAHVLHFIQLIEAAIVLVPCM